MRRSQSLDSNPTLTKLSALQTVKVRRTRSAHISRRAEFAYVKTEPLENTFLKSSGVSSVITRANSILKKQTSFSSQDQIFTNQSPVARCVSFVLPSTDTRSSDDFNSINSDSSLVANDGSHNSSSSSLGSRYSLINIDLDNKSLQSVLWDAFNRQKIPGYEVSFTNSPLGSQTDVSEHVESESISSIKSQISTCSNTFTSVTGQDFSYRCSANSSFEYIEKIPSCHEDTKSNGHLNLEIVKVVRFKSGEIEPVEPSKVKKSTKAKTKAKSHLKGQKTVPGNNTVKISEMHADSEEGSRRDYKIPSIDSNEITHNGREAQLHTVENTSSRSRNPRIVAPAGYVHAIPRARTSALPHMPIDIRHRSTYNKRARILPMSSSSTRIRTLPMSSSRMPLRCTRTCGSSALAGHSSFPRNSKASPLYNLRSEPLAAVDVVTKSMDTDSVYSVKKAAQIVSNDRRAHKKYSTKTVGMTANSSFARNGNQHLDKKPGCKNPQNWVSKLLRKATKLNKKTCTTKVHDSGSVTMCLFNLNKPEDNSVCEKSEKRKIETSSIAPSSRNVCSELPYPLKRCNNLKRAGTKIKSMFRSKDSSMV